jgi:hypothetical protein
VAKLKEGKARVETRLPSWTYETLIYKDRLAKMKTSRQPLWKGKPWETSTREIRGNIGVIFRFNRRLRVFYNLSRGEFLRNNPP